jgi:hypothetical protein
VPSNANRYAKKVEMKYNLQGILGVGGFSATDGKEK